MSAILTSLLAPNLAHVIFAVAGGLFGYWLKRHPDTIPAEVKPVVDLLLARLAAQEQNAAHDRLQVLAQPVASVVSVPTVAK